MLAEIDQKQREINNRKTQLETQNSEHKQKCSEYEEQIKNVKTELEKQKKLFEELTKGEDIVKRLEYEITMLKKAHQGDLDKLKASVEKEVRSKMAAEKKFKDLAESYENQLSILNKDIVSKLEEIEKLNKEITRQKAYNNMFKEDIENQGDTIKSLNREIEELKSKYQATEKELSELKERFAHIPDIDFDEIKNKEKIAKMKEAKIMSLLLKLDNVMSSMQSNMS